MAVHNNVYIFNSWEESLNSFSINGVPSPVGGGTIPGSSTAQSSMYTPGANSDPYPRDLDKLSGSPQFYVGEGNMITFLTNSSGFKSATITIPGINQNVTLEQDLIIYITQNLVLVMLSTGVVMGTFDVN